MDKIIIQGGKRLSGTIPISGAKNSALTLLPCALLTDEPLTLRNLPRLADIDGFQHLLNQFGISTTIAGSRPSDFGRVMTLEATRITSSVAPYELVRKMRASILVLGPMLARMGEATVSLPGGCAIGNRPIDLHLKVLEALGATIELAAGYVRAIAPDGGLPGGRYSFPVVSVGATENALMAAVLCKGKSTLHNAAREPEIVDLCNLLVDMGAEIEGIGTSRHHHPRRPAPPRRDLPRHVRPDRGGLLCLRRGDHRRRSDAEGRENRRNGRHRPGAARRRGFGRAGRRRHSRRRQWRACGRSRCQPPPIPASPPTCRRN